jgi:ribosomal protein S20
MRFASTILFFLLPFVLFAQKLPVDKHEQKDRADATQISEKLADSNVNQTDQIATKGGKTASPLKAQVIHDSTASALINGTLYNAIVVNGDTIPVVSLPAAKATAKRVFKSKKAKNKYYRLAYHVKKVLPYAKLAGKRMKEVEAEVAEMDKQERKKRMKLLEKEIKKDYEGELTKLSFTQGRILIKLLDRETGSISYDIVKEFRGGFTAWFFQGIAKIFSYDLKSEYDAEGDDKVIEQIVQQIEQGTL